MASLDDLMNMALNRLRQQEAERIRGMFFRTNADLDAMRRRFEAGREPPAIDFVRGRDGVWRLPQ